jgi:FG-GAP repeat
MRLARVIALVSLSASLLISLSSTGSSTTGRGPDSTETLCGKPWSEGNNQFLSFFGMAVDTAGDVNGDGYDDVLVGPTATTTRRPMRAGRSCFTAHPRVPRVVPTGAQDPIRTPRSLGARRRRRAT